MPTWRTDLLSVMLFVSFLVILASPQRPRAGESPPVLPPRASPKRVPFTGRSPAVGGDAAASFAGVSPQAPGQRLGNVLAGDRVAHAAARPAGDAQPPPQLVVRPPR